MLMRAATKFTQKLTVKLTFRRVTRGFKNLLDVHPSVISALCRQCPVVALESTIITHGMPYPHNLETALAVEDIVRTVGATPATIGCIDGRLKVGLLQEDIKRLSEASGTNVLKCSRRDLTHIIANRKCAGTTVAATMIIAHMAGIKIFATGGVGGVHRDGHVTMDISADLVELGRTPIVVVSSGVKSILDIPRSLEYLETQGVCVASYNNEGQFPDFFTRDSGYSAAYKLSGAVEAAELIRALDELKLSSGMLIGVPIPQQYALEKDEIKNAIEQAYKEAEVQGVTGNNVTPFMLAEIAKITKGSSLNANIALIKNNAKVAAEIACAKNQIRARTMKTITKSNAPLVIGASILDLSLTLLNKSTIALDGATYQTSTKESAGGVGRNMAEAISKLYGSVNFVSVVGNDQMGKTLLQMMPKQLTDRIRVAASRTTSICAILLDKSGNSKFCLANMEIHNSITPEIIRTHAEEFKSAPLVIMDGNLSLTAMETILDMANEYNKPVFFEPTDMLIAGKPFTLSSTLLKQIRIIFPNVFELKAIVETLTSKKILWEPSKFVDSDIQGIVDNCQLLLKQIEDKFDCIVVTLGPHGVLATVRGNSFTHSFYDVNTLSYIPPDTMGFTSKRYEAPSVIGIVNVTGAGDSFSCGFIAGILGGLTVEQSIAFGFVAATGSLKAYSAIPHHYFENEEEKKILLQQQMNSMKSSYI